MSQRGRLAPVFRHSHPLSFSSALLLLSLLVILSSPAPAMCSCSRRSLSAATESSHSVSHVVADTADTAHGARHSSQDASHLDVLPRDNSIATFDDADDTEDGLDLDLDLLAHLANLTDSSGRALLQWAPANCPYGWTITGDCITETFYQPSDSGVRYEYAKQCKGGWTPTLVRKLVTKLACNVASTLCGPAALVCRLVCKKVVAIAQAQCMDKSLIKSLFHSSFVGSNYACCNKCSFWDKIWGNCPS